MGGWRKTANPVANLKRRNGMKRHKAKERHNCWILTAESFHRAVHVWKGRN